MYPFPNMASFYGGVVTTSPNPEAGGPNLSAVCDCLWNIFAAIGGHFSIRNLTTLHAMVIGTQMLCKNFLFKIILSQDTIFYVSIFTALDAALTNTDCLTLPLHILP
jgi:hypothetical protein